MTRSVTGAATDRSDVELSLTVVRYADRPDRCTMYPPDTDGDVRMSTWLSADRSVFVCLDGMR